MGQIKKNLELIKERIEKAALKSGRKSDEIALVAVTKNVPPPLIEEAALAGQKIFAENRVQELLAKKPFLPSELEWHFVGHLQKNKVKKVVGEVGLIQSVDSLNLAAEIDRRARERNLKVQVLLEVKVSPEETKFGFAPEEMKNVLEKLSEFKGIIVKGLMTIAPLLPAEECRPYFKKVRVLWEDLRKEKPEWFEYLSMGMSDDFEVAIEEGSNMVRIGRAIFERR
jgi:pyridoxal phosphate enzyme (YggS family)